MAKKRKYHNPNHSIMGRSDVPLVDRMRYQQDLRIARERERSAMMVTYIASIALHDVKGVGYRSLIRFGRRYMDYEREVYADGVEVGLAKAKRRLDAMGLEISGERYAAPDWGGTVKDQQVRQHSMEAIQVALTVCALAMNDEFGFAAVVQDRINDRISELAAIYAKQGMPFLLKEMGKLGFEIRNGRAQYYLDAEDNVITKGQAAKLDATARKEKNV